jgi:tRNA(His) 5'-end guanylyltransferase
MINTEQNIQNIKLDDKVKFFENIANSATLDEDLPICVRLDGKAFHTFTKGLKKPFDERLSTIMIDTMNFLLDSTNAQLGYTQSDEITLVYLKTSENQEVNFSGRIQKLTSVLASMATAKFNTELHTKISEKSQTLAFFDCRIWNVPSLQEVAELFRWRHLDAIKNSISIASHTIIGHKNSFKKNSKEKIEIMAKEGVIWDDYPENFKNGTYSIKSPTEIPITEEQKQYKANADKTTITRNIIKNFVLPKAPTEDEIIKIINDNISLKKENNLTKKRTKQNSKKP